ncbi:MAG TPA: DNA polymerase IV [Candidatus Baltobacteraceae bacterium]|jgi:DNA polymerase-4|nr:DNA polymerase IV [Candidatus Baltobacteraceae bacterium]
MIAHFDVDAFYANVEIRDNPDLRGKPVAVAGSSRRAVVLTASYEARPFGVKSAVPLYKALASCPQLIVVRPDMQKYREVSRAIFSIFQRRGHPVEGLSMDEAFIDFGPLTLEDALHLAAAIREEVLHEVGLTVSAGVAGGKMVAKILSDSCKPNGLQAVAPGEEAAFLAPLPVGRLWGVGPKTEVRLRERGIQTIGDLAALSDERVAAIFGSWGAELRELARGLDQRAVEPERETKSISTEETFEYDVRDEQQLRELLKEQARELSAKLQREGLSACTIGIKVKRSDFQTIVRQTNLDEPTDDARAIFVAAVHCLRRAELHNTAVRLLGTRVASLVAGEPKQQTLFTRQT